MTNKSIQKTKPGELAISDTMRLLFQENAEVGSKNLSGELPLLKVHAAGRSQKNELADGSEPKDGAFFYKPTREQFDSVIVHILSVSRGFRAEGLEDKKDIFNQIVSGVIVDGAELKPFTMYFTGLKLQNLWNFGKEASAYTKAKPVPVPMFALTVKLTTKKVAHKFGKSWVVEFEILRQEGGAPIVVTDEGLFVYLKDNVEIVEGTINTLIDSKAGEKVADLDYDIPDDFPDGVENG